MTSVNPNGFTTLSDVLVGDDGYMYFRGTDNAVWRVNPMNAADNTNFGGPDVIATQSNVVAVGGYMYLRGTDDKVWQVRIGNNPDPNNPGRVNLGGFTTWSDVLVGDDGYLYFRGTDNAVWRVNPMNAAENTNFGGPDVIATQSNVVAVGGYMYLRGTDDKVWRVNIHNPDPNNPGRVNLGGFTTWSDVLVGDDGYLYFRGTDNAVWRVHPANADNTNFGGPGVIATQSNVVAVGGYMYLRGTDDKVWRVNMHNNPNNPPQMLNPLHLEGDPSGFVTLSNVNCSRGMMYFRGTDDKVWETDGVPYPNPSGFGDAVSVPSAPRIYIENTDPRRIDNLDLVLRYNADFGGPYELHARLPVFGTVSTWGLNSAMGGVGALQEEGSQLPIQILQAQLRQPGGAWGDTGPINPSITITKEDAAEISGMTVTASFTINGQRYNTAVLIGDFNQYYQLELNAGKLTITHQGPEREINPAFLRFLEITLAILEFGGAIAGSIALARTKEGGQAAGLSLRTIM
jgi:hypothetical protein